MKTCPYCAEEIREEAIKCKYCGSMVDTLLEPAIYAIGTPKPTVLDNGIHLIIIGALVVAGGFVTLLSVPVAGIGAIVLGLLTLAAGFNPTGRAECPKCGSKVVIIPDKTQVKCRGCSADINVEWTEREKVKLPY